MIDYDQDDNAAQSEIHALLWQNPDRILERLVMDNESVEALLSFIRFGFWRDAEKMRRAAFTVISKEAVEIFSALSQEHQKKNDHALDDILR